MLVSLSLLHLGQILEWFAKYFCFHLLEKILSHFGVVEENNGRKLAIRKNWYSDPTQVGPEFASAIVHIVYIFSGI